MILKNISMFGVLCGCVFILSPQHTEAYYTTHQQVDKVTDQTALYSITYSFGFPDVDAYMPIFAVRDLQNDITNHNLGYSFTPNHTGSSSDGTSVAMVLSDAPIENNMYKIPAGTNQTFTLFAFLTLDKTAPSAKYALQVNNLPYVKVLADKSEKDLGLNIHELSHYVTKEARLNN